MACTGVLRFRMTQHLLLIRSYRMLGLSSGNNHNNVACSPLTKQPATNPLTRVLKHTLTTDNKDISYEDLKALLEKRPNLFLVDVRSQGEVDKGRIPGSLHIPVDTVEAAFAMKPEEFKAKYGVTMPPKDAPELVFHCQMGKRGATATSKAHQLGYKSARNYAGGYKEWSEKEGK